MNKSIIKDIFILLICTTLVFNPIFFSVWGNGISEKKTKDEYVPNQDFIAPSLSLVQPENLSVITGWFFILVTATDNILIDQVVYRNINSPIFEQMSQNETDPTKFRALIDSNKYKNGVNIFEIKANDTSNNEKRIILFLAINNLEAEADIYVYNATGLIKDCPCLTDNFVSPFWANFSTHPILEYGGYIKFSHNFTHIFGLFVYDSALKWISLQFDNDGDGICMEDGEDIWWFEEGKTVADYTAANFKKPIPDNNQDIDFEFGIIQDNDSELEYVEMMRIFTTNEETDVKFQFGVPIAIIFASNSLHQGGNRANFSLALRSSPPIDINNTEPLNTTDFGTFNAITDLFIFGGFGLFLNAILIIGLIIYDKKRIKH